MHHPEPKLAAEFTRTINEKDVAGFIALFAEDAEVDDAGRIIQGRAAILKWATSDIFAVNVSFHAPQVTGDENNSTITARIEGTFDRTNLPNPLIMTMYLKAKGPKLTHLKCRLATPA